MEKNLNLFRTFLSKLSLRYFAVAAVLGFLPGIALAQTPRTEDWIISPGIIGTIILITIVALIAVLIGSIRLVAHVETLRKKNALKTGQILEDPDRDTEQKRLSHKASTSDQHHQVVRDERVIISKATEDPENPFVDEKKISSIYIETREPLKKIVIWCLGASIGWLLFGTLIGQYTGMKFLWPEIDTISWLSFGRIRPVHTNTVFWDWASLAMIGLGYFVITRTSNNTLYSYRMAWTAWWLMNLSVLIGNILLMSGVNNGGGEYREYIWPVAALFASGLLLTFINYYKTVARRRIPQIYISNWYILAALIWTITLVIIGYLPSFQDGLGETVIQGYYMHQGVGM